MMERQSCLLFFISGGNYPYGIVQVPLIFSVLVFILSKILSFQVGDF